MNAIQACKLLFGTVMHGYHTDQNPEEGIYSFNFEAGHCTFVKQWEMTQFIIGKSGIFFEIIFLVKKKSKSVHISPKYAGYNILLGLLRKIQVLKKFSENLVFRFFLL